MMKHLHAARVFEWENLRLPNGNYTADAPEKLHQFWLQYGLYVQLDRIGTGDTLGITHMTCVEDIS